MDAQRKSIQALTVNLDEKREELSSLYRQFGAKLLNDTADRDRSVPGLDAERVDAWRTFMGSRELDTQTVLDIKTALARIAELNQFKKELESTKSEIARAKDSRLEELGRAVLNADGGDVSEFFGPGWQAALDASRNLDEVLERQRSTREELENAGFFTKMKAQFRLAGIESDLRQKREKCAKLLREGGARVLSSDEAARRIEQGEFGSEMEELLDSAREAADRDAELSSREKTLEADMGAMKNSLADAGALENPQRRMDELRSKIRDTDRRIDSHASLVAREYVDSFYDDEGRSRIGYSPEAPESAGLGVYARQLEQAAALRGEIASIRVKIEILETAIRMDALDRNISQWQRMVKDYEQRIKKYQELISSAERDIREAEQERDRLRETKSVLEASQQS